MARRLARPTTTTGALLAATVLALGACSGGGDGITDDSPADGASGTAGATAGPDDSEGTDGGGPAEPFELGALGDVLGAGQGLALFGSVDGEEPVEGITTPYETLVDADGPVGWDAPTLPEAHLALSDAGLFGSGSTDAGYMLARLDPATGQETWSVEQSDMDPPAEGGCAFAGSGGALVVLGCTQADGTDLTFLDAETGDERFTLPAEPGTEQNVVAFDPLVVQHSGTADDGAATLTVHDPATGKKLASHDDVALCNELEAGHLCGAGTDGPRHLAVDGTLVVTAGDDDAFGSGGDVAAVDPATGEVAWSVGDGDGGTALLGASTDGVIVTSSDRDEALLLDLPTGEELAATEILDDLLFDRASGIYPLGDGTFVADGLDTSDDTDWLVSLASMFPDG